jgi:hypothetical protein
MTTRPLLQTQLNGRVVGQIVQIMVLRVMKRLSIGLHPGVDTIFAKN